MLVDILERIDKVRTKDIEILAVTKTRSVEEILTLVGQGITLIGENRVQEAQEKLSYIGGVQKHLIGALQSNKENKALELFDVIQSIESLAQLKRISDKLHKNNLQKSIFLQCNTSLEDSKHGVREAEDLYPMIDFILSQSSVKLCGLMTIGALSNDETTVRKSFSKLACIKHDISVKYAELSYLKLSMGMSNDFEWAIQEGADIIRLGRILFDN